MDYQALLFDPVYSTLGVPGLFTLAAGGDPVDLTVIDKTAGIAVGSSVEVQTILPGAVVRVQELTDKGLAPDDLDFGTLVMNSQSWTVASHILRPTGNGLADGECLMVLEG